MQNYVSMYLTLLVIQLHVFMHYYRSSHLSSWNCCCIERGRYTSQPKDLSWSVSVQSREFHTPSYKQTSSIFIYSFWCWTTELYRLVKLCHGTQSSLWIWKEVKIVRGDIRCEKLAIWYRRYLFWENATYTERMHAGFTSFLWDYSIITKLDKNK